MTASMLERIEADLRARPSVEEPAPDGDLVVQHDNDSVLHVVSEIPNVIAILPMLLDHQDDEDFTYRSGVLTIHTQPQRLHYRPLYMDCILGWDGEQVTMRELLIGRRESCLGELCAWCPDD